MVTGVEEEQNLAVLVRPVADEGASGRIFALVVVVPKRYDLSFQLFRVISFRVFSIFNKDILDIFRCKPEFFAANFALVAVETLLVAFCWLGNNLKISSNII